MKLRRNRNNQPPGQEGDLSYKLPVNTATVEALGRLNREVVLALAGEEHQSDAHYKFRLGLLLTPTSQVHHSRYTSEDNNLEALGVRDLDSNPPVIAVPQVIIEALGLSESS
jgi:hypothetical protein